MQDGSWRRDQATTVKQLLVDHWLPAQRSRGLRPSTIALYELAVDHWIVPHLGGGKAGQLTPRHVIDLIDACARTRPPAGARGRRPTRRR
ncbi:MAG: hypothetical protein ACRDYZ_01750 [Acidimicrobiales bacterium]